MLLTDSLLQLGDVVQLPLAAVLGSDLVLAATPESVNILTYLDIFIHI